MIDLALQFVVAELNSFLFARTGTEFGKAELGRLVDETGKWVGTDNQIAAALINLEEERAVKAQVPETTYLRGRQVLLQPELKLNLHVVFAANFQRSDQALRQLSYILIFFRSHPVFTRDEYAAMDPRMTRLAVDLLSLSYEQLNQVWAFTGGKRLPSVFYCLRLVLLQDAEPESVGPLITTVIANVHGR